MQGGLLGGRRGHQASCAEPLLGLGVHFPFWEEGPQLARVLRGSSRPPWWLGHYSKATG